MVWYLTKVPSIKTSDIGVNDGRIYNMQLGAGCIQKITGTVYNIVVEYLLYYQSGQNQRHLSDDGQLRKNKQRITSLP
ncbi:MAG: hypothetical protein KA536_11595 [Saprospiraceae bacterium]|nr:hypothetical protein [Saprospiraceae bacterium]